MAVTPMYPVTGNVSLSGKWPSDAGKQAELNIIAEQLLGLKAPAYTGDKAELLVKAVVSQINFMVQRGIEPDVVKSVSNTHPGNTTSYRDRFIDPDAYAQVCAVTGRRAVGFRAPGMGV